MPPHQLISNSLFIFPAAWCPQKPPETRSFCMNNHRESCVSMCPFVNGITDRQYSVVEGWMTVLMLNQMPQVKPAKVFWSVVMLSQHNKNEECVQWAQPIYTLPSHPWPAVRSKRHSVSQSRGLMQAHGSQEGSRLTIHSLFFSHGSPVLLQEAP